MSGISWSVDIEAIPPPAPGWDTGWGEEGRWEENNDKACSRILQFYDCWKCGKRFKHRKSIKRHNIRISNCEHNQENIAGRSFVDFEQFSRITCRTKSSSIKQDVEQSTDPSDLRSDNLSLCQICLAHCPTPDKVQIHRDEQAGAELCQAQFKLC